LTHLDESVLAGLGSGTRVFHPPSRDWTAPESPRRWRCWPRAWRARLRVSDQGAGRHTARQAVRDVLLIRSNTACRRGRGAAVRSRRAHLVGESSSPPRRGAGSLCDAIDRRWLSRLRPPRADSIILSTRGYGLPVPRLDALLDWTTRRSTRWGSRTLEAEDDASPASSEGIVLWLTDPSYRFAVDASGA